MATDIEKELERTTQLRGFRYGLHDYIAQLGGAEALKKLNDKMEAEYLHEGLIDRKTKELLIVVTCMALKDSLPHLQLHMHAAHKAGSTPEEILEAVKLTGSWMDTVARIRGQEAWRATFRPDIPPIDRVAELR